MDYLVLQASELIRRILFNCEVQEKIDGSSLSFVKNKQGLISVSRSNINYNFSHLNQFDPLNFSHSYLRSAFIYLNSISHKLNMVLDKEYKAEVIYLRYPNVINYKKLVNTICLFDSDLLIPNDLLCEIEVTHPVIDSYLGPVNQTKFSEKWNIEVVPTFIYSDKICDYFDDLSGLDSRLDTQQTLHETLKSQFGTTGPLEGYVIKSRSFHPLKVLNLSYLTHRRDLRKMHQDVYRVTNGRKLSFRTNLTNLARIIDTHNNTVYTTDIEKRWKVRRDELIYVALQKPRVWEYF